MSETNPNQPAPSPIPPMPPVPPPPSPQPPKPLDLGPFSTAPIAPTDPALRQALLTIGVQVGMLMLNNRTNPEEVAQKVGLPKETVYQVMVGCEDDIGIRALNELAKALGGKLAIQLLPPSAPVAPTA